VSKIKRFTHYHHLQVSDNDTLDLLYFNGKLRYKKNNNTYSSFVAKTVKDNRASENYVKREIVEKLKRKDSVIEVRDSGWKSVETVNDMEEDGIERRPQIRLKHQTGRQ
jgi:hypothetical protein